MEFNQDTIKFLKAFNYEKIAIRTFSDIKSKFKGIDKKEDKIRCNICGKYYDERELYLGIKNRPICKSCSSVKVVIKPTDIYKFKNILWAKNKYSKHGVHLAINGEHTDKEITKVYAQFFEIDDKSMEEQMKIVEELPLKPSMVVKTRKSLHVYFLIKDGNIKLFRQIQGRLAYTFGGDPQKCNESTCMRIPGFYHNKKEPIMVKLVQYNPELVYTQSQIIKELKLLRLPEKPKKERKSFDYDGNKNELVEMVYSHIRENIFYERTNKIVMSCINPSHNDDNPSAVFFKDSLWFYCKGCGYSKGLYDVAIENNWTDIITFLNSRVS